MYNTLKGASGIVGVVFGFCLLNSGLFFMTSTIDSPTVIGGLGWTLSNPILGNPLITGIVFFISLGVNRFCDRKLAEQANANKRPFEF